MKMQLMQLGHHIEYNYKNKTNNTIVDFKEGFSKKDYHNMQLINKYKEMTI